MNQELSFLPDMYDLGIHTWYGVFPPVVLCTHPVNALHLGGVCLAGAPDMKNPPRTVDCEQYCQDYLFQIFSSPFFISAMFTCSFSTL